MPTPLALDILFQDEWLVAVDKPAGQLVHPAEVPQEGDEVTMKILRDQIGKRVNTLHRLDRPTAGVLLFATDETAARALRRAFDAREIKKIYWAVTIGCPEEEAWICYDPIQKEEGAPSREAKTVFRRLADLGDGLGLVEARPETGRFHQIRRHLLAAGTPILGDYRYSGIERCDALGAKHGTGTRMLLQAKVLEFTHPITKVRVMVEAPVDPLIAGLLAK